MRADINTIASKCGVSKATVSRVFTGKAPVGQAIKEKVLSVAKALNYSPQQLATHDCICIITNSSMSSCQFEFYSMLTIHLLREIVHSGYGIKIMGFDGIDRILQSYTKAAVILAGQDSVAKYHESLASLNIPLIAVNQRGYLIAMRRLGLPEMAELCYADNNNSMTEVLVKLRRTDATAVIVCGEGIVPETAYALNLLDIKVPDELSLISFEQPDFSKWLTPPHTTIHQPVELMASEIMSSLMSLIKNPSQPKSVKMLKCKINSRQSVKSIWAS